jgi:hypothetical protein
MSNAALRRAVEQNRVSFPAQIPHLTCHDKCVWQERIVLLYFVQGWTITSICKRYDVCKTTIERVLTEWRTRAIAAGYVQDITPTEGRN